MKVTLKGCSKPDGGRYRCAFKDYGRCLKTEYCRYQVDGSWLLSVYLGSGRGVSGNKVREFLDDDDFRMEDELCVKWVRAWRKSIDDKDS